MCSTKTDQGATTGNELLDSLPFAERQAVYRAGKNVSVAIGEEPYRQGDEMRFAYFPTSAVYSIVIALRSGARAEIGTIGKEGLLGVPILVGLDKSPYAAMSQVAGNALQLPAAALKEFVDGGTAFATLMRRYTAYTFQYANQTVACNAFHSLQSRACRRLLMAQDRVGSNQLNITHEFLAEMLGVARQSVTLAAGALQRAGLIRYTRGDITIVDRERLERKACECYSEIKRFYRETVIGVGT